MTEQPTKSETEYVILEFVPPGSWDEFGRGTGRDSHAAIKAALETNPTGGTFVAIPARSWKPVKVTTKTETTLVLDDGAWGSDEETG